MRGPGITDGESTPSHLATKCLAVQRFTNARKLSIHVSSTCCCFVPYGSGAMFGPTPSPTSPCSHLLVLSVPTHLSLAGEVGRMGAMRKTGDRPTLVGRWCYVSIPHSVTGLLSQTVSESHVWYQGISVLLWLVIHVDSLEHVGGV